MIQDISVIELKRRIDTSEALNILDVREQYEFDEFNLNGKLIPLGELPGQLDELIDWKNEEIIVHCRSGKRSATAQQFLLQNGFVQMLGSLKGR